MPRNGAGTYTPPAGQPVVNGTIVSSSVFNALVADLGVEITKSISTDGQTPMAANFPMGGNKITGLAAGTLPTDSAQIGQLAASDGADLLGFIQSGAGALVDTVQDELRQVVRVTQFAGTDTVAAQAAFTSRMLTGGRVIFPAGRTYTITAAITVYPNTEVVIEPGAIVDISGVVAGGYGFIAAGSEGAKYPCLVGGATGENNVLISPSDLSASGIAVNDWVRVASNAVMDASRTSSEIGEILQVVSLDAGTGAIRFWTPLHDTYNVSDGAEVSKVTLMKGISFSGGGLITDSRNDLDDHTALEMRLCISPKVTNLRFEKITAIAVHFRDCIEPRADAIHGDDFWAAFTGYLICVDSATQDGLITNIFANRVRHLFTTSNSTATKGIPRRITLDGAVSINSATASAGLPSGGDAIDTHAAAEQIHLKNIVVMGSSSIGVNIECASGSLTNVFVYGALYSGVSVQNWTDRPGDWVLNNVHTYDTARYGVQVFDSPSAQPYNRLVMDNVSSTNASDLPIYVRGTAAAPVKNAILSNIQVITPKSSADAVRLENVNGFSASNISCKDPTDATIASLRVRDCLGGIVSNVVSNAATNATGLVVWVNSTTAGSCKDITVDGVIVLAGTYTSLRGIVVDTNAQNIILGTNNNLRRANTAINAGFGTTNRINFEPFTYAYTIPSLAAGASNTQNIAVSGIALGDLLQVSSSVDLQGMVLSCVASGTGGIRVGVQNITAGTINIGAVTLKFRWFRPGI